MNHYEERAIQTSILLSFGVCSHNTGTIWKQHKIVTDRPLVSTKTTQCLPVHVENGRIWKRNPNSRYNLKTASCEPSRGLKRNIFHPTFFNALQTRADWLFRPTWISLSLKSSLLSQSLQWHWHLQIIYHFSNRAGIMWSLAKILEPSYFFRFQNVRASCERSLKAFSEANAASIWNFSYLITIMYLNHL